MSKRPFKIQQTVAKEHLPEVKAIEPETINPASIADCRRCPICWGGNGGYGDCRSTQGGTRYYKCMRTLDPNKPPCGHTWTAQVQLIVTKIEHKVVTLDGER